MLRSKTWESLTLSDDFIFKKYMLNKDNCKKLLKEILGKEVTHIKYITIEKSENVSQVAKGIRVDVYVKGDNKIYSVEMQSVKKEALDKRARYYHSVLDSDALNKGEYYTELKDSYVIFICTFDPFGENMYMYNIKNECAELKEKNYDDGSYTIFVNTKGKNGKISEDLKIFLEAVEGHFDSSVYSAKIKSEVESIKNHSEWRSEYMLQEQHDMEKIREGEEHGQIEAVKKMLASMSKEQIIAMDLYESICDEAVRQISLEK